MALATPNSRPDPTLAQSVVERAFPGLGMDICTARNGFAKQERDTGDRFYLERGIITGDLAERQVVQWAEGNGFAIGLHQEVDRLIAKRRLATLSDEQRADIRSSAVAWVRGWQEQFPPEDDDCIPWTEIETVLLPQTDIFLHRQELCIVKVRPDVVVGAGRTLIAYEFTTARDPDSVSPVRAALNYFALMGKRMRLPEWLQYEEVVTRVEHLALGYGETVRLTPDEAEAWRERILAVVPAILAEHYVPNRGPWCSRCRYQPRCWGGDGEDGEAVRF
jgi:hypothetical protein